MALLFGGWGGGAYRGRGGGAHSGRGGDAHRGHEGPPMGGGMPMRPMRPMRPMFPIFTRFLVQSRNRGLTNEEDEKQEEPTNGVIRTLNDICEYLGRLFNAFTSL